MSFLQSFAHKALPVLILAGVFVGCGPQDGRRELSAGRAAYEAGDLKKAESFLLKSESKNPTNVDTQVSLALVNLRQGELERADRQIANAASQAGGDVDVRLLGAQIAWHRKENDKALALYRSIAEDAELDVSMRSRGWTGIGIVQMTIDSYDLARVAFLTAIRLDRRNATARYHLGHLYRYAPFAYQEAALEQFQAFLYLHAEADARVQKTKSSIIPALKDSIAHALMEVPGALKRNSSSSATALSRAEKALKKGQYKQAANAYQEALNADPLAYPAALGLARSLAKAVEKKEEHPESLGRALYAYRRACALRSGAVSTFIEAGALAERLKQYTTAREIYSRALAANPASLDALDGLIRAFRRAGDHKAGSAYCAYRNLLGKK